MSLLLFVWGRVDILKEGRRSLGCAYFKGVTGLGAGARIRPGVEAGSLHSLDEVGREVCQFSLRLRV